MKKGFRGVPRPLLSAMLPIVAVDQSAGQADQAVDQPSPSEPLPSSSHPPVLSATTESEPKLVAEPITYPPSLTPEQHDKSEVFKTHTRQNFRGGRYQPYNLWKQLKLCQRVLLKVKVQLIRVRYKRRKSPKGKDIDTGFEDISTGFEDISTGFEEVNTGGLGVSTGSGPIHFC
ncbi:hypothetical protein Tco_0626096 [Tanacetum coccineum]|uniref:Uncharacterized protein n=1 Tax=Tanacetum coccineum TaxID=301880 RepID=A0ABQ4WIN7_9ASTR